MNLSKSIGGPEFDRGKHDGALGHVPNTSDGHYLKGYIEGKYIRWSGHFVALDPTPVDNTDRETVIHIIEKAADQKVIEVQEKLVAQIAITSELERKLNVAEQELNIAERKEHAAETRISGLEQELQFIRNQMLDQNQAPSSVNVEALEATIEVLKKFAAHKPACALVTITRTTRDRGPFAKNTKKVCTCGLQTVLATIDK